MELISENGIMLEGLVAGIDEAGRGCLAGPVSAAAVILPDSFDLPGLTDSKVLTAKKREALYPEIKRQAISWAVAASWPRVIDSINILQATFVAMAKSVRGLDARPTMILVDGNKNIPGAVLNLKMRQKAVVGGDGKIPAISAASILAKVWRDRLMLTLDRRHPGYGFAEHMGYGTASHMKAVRKLGPSPVHRLTFRGVKPESAEKQACLPI